MKKHLIITYSFLVLLNQTLKAQLITFSSNPVCDDREIPDHYPVTIDPYNLPASCMEYDEVGSLNLDLVFEDEFNGPSLDLDKWIGAFAQRGKLFNKDISGSEGPQVLDFYDGPLTLPDNFDFGTSGSLNLKAKKVTDFWANTFSWHAGNNPAIYGGGPCNPDSVPDMGMCILKDGFPNYRRYSYTSGALTSQRSFKYGYFVIRCKVPTIEGVWPAFWLYTEGGNRTEIDVFEFAQDKLSDCNPENAYLASQRMFLTYWDWQGNADSDEPQKCNSIDATAEDFLFINTWHTYSLYWDEFKLIWIFDGTPIRIIYKYTWEKRNIFGHVTDEGGIDDCSELADKASDSECYLFYNNYYPDEQCHVIVGMGVKNFGTTYNPLSTSDNSCSTLIGESAMEIDYIRVYGIRACNDADGTVYFCSDNPTHVPSYITAPNLLNIAGTCDVIVENDRPDAMAWGDFSHGHHVYATAANEVNLWEGFHAQEGSEFTASLQPCTSADLRINNPSPNVLSNAQISSQVQAATILADVNFKKNLPPSGSVKNAMTIQPNPAQNSFQVVWDGEQQDVDLRVVNAIGEPVYQEKIKNFAGTQINSQSLNNGIYYVEVQANGQKFSQKLIVSK